MKLSKTDKKVLTWIYTTLSAGHFTWSMDIVTNTMWGFKNAPYKTSNRAHCRVMELINMLEGKSYIELNKDVPLHSCPTISRGKHFRYWVLDRANY